MSHRMRALDGLRGILALYILAGHTLPFLWLPPGLGWVAGLVSHGRAAVDLFFALSGLVILHALEEGGFPGRAGAGRFLALRAGRLLPVYLLALGLACLGLAAGDPFAAMPWLAPDSAAHAVAGAHWPPQLALHLAAHVLLLQGLLPPALLPGAEYAILGPAWSLSTEWQFYGFMALCLAIAPRLLAAGGGRATILLLLLGVIGLGIAALPESWRFGHAFLPRDAWYFALGTASHAFLSGRTSRARYGLVLAGATVLSGVAGGIGAMLVPLVWTLCLRAERPRMSVDHALRRLLMARPLVWCGGISYTLYLIHAPLQRLLMLGIAPWAGGDGRLFTLLWALPAILLPLAAAALVHRWIEEPIRLWSRTRILGAPRPGLTPFGSGSYTSVAGRL
ncbi:MAG TPA: acyltransferase [Acidisoma sp.]|uniref:acyltransferase family protein n=1 Tax=Acidisoma sp. TaxID=1872115 RepID=UPI002BA81267|nr:acyltransferase [Acidisoma sp.]HTI03651.1 acyltransferase [Acidisoma sp.]